MFKTLLCGVGGVLIGYLAFMYFANSSVSWRDKDENGYTACTLEAKLCPDGSAVGRTGPNCEFAKCPGE